MKAATKAADTAKIISEVSTNKNNRANGTDFLDLHELILIPVYLSSNNFLVPVNSLVSSL